MLGSSCVPLAVNMYVHHGNLLPDMKDVKREVEKWWADPDTYDTEFSKWWAELHPRRPAPKKFTPGQYGVPYMFHRVPGLAERLVDMMQQDGVAIRGTH